MIVPMERPLQRVLGPEVADVYRTIHEENGVKIVAGTRVARLKGDRAVDAVETDDGRTVAADLVVAGVGAQPRTELATAAGLAVERGVLVDERLESSVPRIFAAGDVAEAWHPGYGRRLRIEHWDNAKRQGRAVAGSMLGEQKPYDRIPYFYSDQYDLGMEYTGFAPAWDEVIFRGDPKAREFIAFWLHDGRVVAGMNANIWDVTPHISALIASGREVDRKRLADSSAPLEELAAASVA
jgi:3-phenylpropionate/trans-cinnamate dioxygenase ferredoxin reductase subunit